jgi:hypothetical protein
VADHLTPDRLAALVDDEPTVAESAHLAGCAACARERGAYDALLALAGADASRITAPLTSWETLAPALRDAGLIRPAPADGVPAATGDRRPIRSSAVTHDRSAAAGAPRAVWPRLQRIAAVLLLVGGGAVVGRYSAGGALASFAGRGAATAGGSGATGDGTEAGPGIGSSGAMVQATGAPSTAPAPGGLVVSAADPAYAGLPQLHDSVPIFHSPAEALATLSRAEREYRHAAAYLVTADPAGTAGDRREAYRTRLAALDEVAQTTRAALAEAPQDPVLHEYYQSSVNAREATIRELRGALPVGMRLDRY